MSAILGAALRTSLGNTAEQILERVAAGERAGGPNPLFEGETYACPWVAPVPGEPSRSPHARFLSRIARFAMDAAAELSPSATGDRLGLYTAVGGLRAHWDAFMPAFEKQNADLRGAWGKGFRLLHPFWMLQHLSNNSQALLSMQLDARGEGQCFGGAKAGAEALQSAHWALEAGVIDAAIVVAYDSFIEPECLVEMAARGAAATVKDPPPAYTPGACGVVPGEAAAALLLVRGAGLAVREAADGGSGLPSVDTLLRVAEGPPVDLIDGAGVAQPDFDAAERSALAERHPKAGWQCSQSALGFMGAPTALVQAALLDAQIRGGACASALGLSAAAPGLAAALRVEASQPRD